MVPELYINRQIFLTLIVPTFTRMLLQTEEALTYHPLLCQWAGSRLWGAIRLLGGSRFWWETLLLHAQSNISTFSVIGMLWSPSRGNCSCLRQVEIPDRAQLNLTYCSFEYISFWGTSKANHSVQLLWLPTITNTIQLASTSGQVWVLDEANSC